jgi:rod shape-determining protein MreD
VRPLRALGIFTLGLVLEWLWSTSWAVFGLSPCLLLVMTVAIAAYSGPVAGQCYGFFWGLFLDVLGAHTFGAGALALTLVGYCVGVIKRQMDVSSPASQVMVVAVVSLAYALFLGLAGLVFERRFLWGGWSLFVGAPLYNCVVAPPVFFFLRKAVGP